jgi:hypothetical protein
MELCVARLVHSRRFERTFAFLDASTLTGKGTETYTRVIYTVAILTNIHASDGHFVKLVLLLTVSFPTTESDQQTRYMKLHC